mmetsp:Transcript_63670/g.176566  ORF Transcript_63670/g.176566 Transcript_63670/m.176566 type:complete len:433 (-) Transcript_63670:279-1577(-)
MVEAQGLLMGDADHAVIAVASEALADGSVAAASQHCGPYLRAKAWCAGHRVTRALSGATLLLLASPIAWHVGTTPKPAAQAVVAGRLELVEARNKTVAHSTNQTAQAPKCSGKGENCNATQCCQDPGLHCFAKGAGWAACLGSCIAGVHSEDGPDYQDPWGCELVGTKSVTLTTLHWNVHWQCSRAREGSSSTCRSKAGKRLAQLQNKTGAHVVAAIELARNSGVPLNLSAFGLKGWAQVNGQCVGFNPDLWDSVALAFAPGWKVEKSGGGCLNGKSDTRVFAVARVRPPRKVYHCPRLCIVALHAPHMQITEGRVTVSNVCGAALDHCVIAFGDWNVPIYAGTHGGVLDRWADLVSGKPANFILPDERSCCNPEWKYHGFYDHLATNIPGAHTEGKNGSTGYAMFPYQILEENPVEEHKPLAVWLQLPAAN